MQTLLISICLYLHNSTSQQLLFCRFFLSLFLYSNRSQLWIAFSHFYLPKFVLHFTHSCSRHMFITAIIAALCFAARAYWRCAIIFLCFSVCAKINRSRCLRFLCRNGKNYVTQKSASVANCNANSFLRHSKRGRS